MDFGQILITIIGAAIGGVITHLLVCANLRRRDLWAAATGGVIYPNPNQCMPIALIFGAAAGGCMYAMYYSYMIFMYERMYIWSAGFIICTVLSWASLCYVWDRAYHLNWDAHGLSGPVNYWFFPLGPRRKSMNYNDIVAIGMDRWESFTVQDSEGDLIRWSYMYKGFAALNAQIEEQRPDLFEDLRCDYDDDDLY